MGAFASRGSCRPERLLPWQDVDGPGDDQDPDHQREGRLDHQPGGASSGVAFWGKAKLAGTGAPAARSAGPPRSSSQYHRLKTITLATQMAAPRPSSTVAVTPLAATMMS